MVGGPADFVQVTLGDGGVLAQDPKQMLIDSTSVDGRRLPKSARRLNQWCAYVNRACFGQCQSG